MDKDAAMRNTGNKIYDTAYDLFTNNCADLVEDIAFSGRINLYSDFLSFGSITIPNDQYEVAVKIAESSSTSTSSGTSTSGYNTYNDLNYNATGGEF